MGISRVGSNPTHSGFLFVDDSLPERSKGLRSGRSIFVYAGSNPATVIFPSGPMDTAPASGAGNWWFKSTVGKFFFFGGKKIQ
jgi:hypothetical protein